MDAFFIFSNYVSCTVGDKVLPTFKILERYLRLQCTRKNITTPSESNSQVQWQNKMPVHYSAGRRSSSGGLSVSKVYAIGCWV